MLSNLYLIQQNFAMGEAVRYSVGLVIICFLLLMMLWLPDILKED